MRLGDDQKPTASTTNSFVGRTFTISKQSSYATWIEYLFTGYKDTNEKHGIIRAFTGDPDTEYSLTESWFWTYFYTGKYTPI